QAGKRLAAVVKLLAQLCAAQSFRKLAHFELVHLVLQRTQGYSKVLGRVGHIPAVLLERSQNEVPLERVRRRFEEVFRVLVLRLELREMKLERQILFRDVVLVADRD